MNGYLYLIKNSINSKVYIGITYRCIKTRWIEHKKCVKRFPHRSLYKAINLYGIDKFDIVCLGVYKAGMLELEEIRAISKYNSYLEGYNDTRGGESSSLNKLEYKKTSLNNRKKKVYCESLDLEFESLTACAQYLIDIGICTGTAISVRKSLTKACTGSRKTYKKLKFKYI